MIREYRVYRANNKNTGAASKFQLSFKKKSRLNKETGKQFDWQEPMLFWVAAKQTGMDGENATYSWDEEDVTMKMGLVDIGEILAVLSWKKTQAGGDRGLYHQNPLGNTSLQLTTWIKDGKRLGYNIRLYAKREGKPDVEVKHGMSIGEGEILKILLENFISRYHEW